MQNYKNIRRFVDFLCIFALFKNGYDGSSKENKG